MNRVLGDYFETLLYKIFVSIDEHTTVSEVRTCYFLSYKNISDGQCHMKLYLHGLSIFYPKKVIMETFVNILFTFFLQLANVLQIDLQLVKVSKPNHCNCDFCFLRSMSFSLMMNICQKSVI